MLDLLVALQARETLVLSNLLLTPDFIRLVLVRLAGRANKVGLDGSDQGSDPLAVGHRLGHLLAVHPVTPAVQPRVVIFAALQVDVEVPVNATKPVRLELVQLRHRDTRDLGPRAVLERVVVEELAAKEQGDGQHPPDLSLMRVEGTQLLQAIDSLRQIIHSEENRSLGQTCRRQDLRDELAEGGGNVRSRGDQLNSHLGDVLGHHIDLVVEDSTNTSTRHFGDARVVVWLKVARWFDGWGGDLLRAPGVELSNVKVPLLAGEDVQG